MPVSGLSVSDDPWLPPEGARPVQHGLRAGLLSNLAGGFGLLLLQRVPPDRFVRTFDQLLVLLILNLVLWAGLDTFHAEAGTQLMLDALYGWACYLLMGLFACALVARADSREADTRALLVPVLAVSPYVLVLFWLSTDVSQVRNRPVMAILVALLYVTVLSVRVLRAAFGLVRTRAVITAIVLILVTPVVLEVLDLDTRLWLADDAQETQDADDSSTAEPLLYDQPARIAAAVERLTPEQQGTPGVYFVGFAGDGDQAIFKREALYAGQVFADHFGSGERSVELINDVEDRDSYPLATVSGLQQTLKLVATRMDPEQDVLVLALTSHGSEEGLAVSNGALPLLQLGPTDLRQALDESGIKWRVVIVSACYAGVFLETLKSDTTLVVTASDAEHSSFGCDDDRDLTYFGEAFLKDSVPSTASLEAAFKKAADLIQRREGAEHKIHSNPQLYVGARIREKLAGLESGPPRNDKGSVTVRR
jgi:hypothetical protein